MTTIRGYTNKATLELDDAVLIQEDDAGSGGDYKHGFLSALRDLLQANFTVITARSSGFNIGVRSESTDNAASMHVKSAAGSPSYLFFNNNLESNRITSFDGGGMDFSYGTSATKACGYDASGNFSVVGALSKGSGSFRIDHPLMPETRDLVHSFVESPRAENLYSGMVQLVDGMATVNIDEHSGMTEGTYEALNHTRSWSSSNESGYAPVKCSMTGNILTIECQDTTSTDNVYFEVRGERKDQHMLETSWTDENGKVIVEPEKPQEALEGEN